MPFLCQTNAECDCDFPYLCFDAANLMQMLVFMRGEELVQSPYEPEGNPVLTWK